MKKFKFNHKLIKVFLLNLVALMLFACGGGGASTSKDNKGWLTTWMAAPTGPSSLTGSASFLSTITLSNQTIRMIVRSSAAGSKVRIRLSNEIGDAPAPMYIGAASIALRDNGSSTAHNKVLTFSGKQDVVIASKGFVFSDPVELDIPALTDLAISLFLPEKVVLQSAHFVTRQTNYLVPNNEVVSAVWPETSATSPYWFLLTGVDVMVNQPTALVAMGASIVDGAGGSLRVDGPSPWPSWPSRLAERLVASTNLAGVSVLNAGISGNRVMSNATGPTAGAKALDRFQRDVLDQRGVSCVVILEGTNDIGNGDAEGRAITADHLIDAYKILIAKAHKAGVKVIGATLTPFSGVSAPYYSENNNAIREAVNLWIRTSAAYDGVIDFDAILRDPAIPKQLLAQYDSGDHLHPSTAGYQAMADGVDLGMLEKFCLKP